VTPFIPTPPPTCTRTLNPAALWRRPVLIGTRATVAALLPQLKTMGCGGGGGGAGGGDAAADGGGDGGGSSAGAPVGCLLLDPGIAEIGGIPVLGTPDDLLTLHASAPFSLAIVSLPASERAATLRLRAALRDGGVVERFVPPLSDLLGGHTPPAPRVNAPDGIDLVELIGRTPYGLDRRAVERILTGKRVLITGAGGSIGSELCRIAATFRPAGLILMERAENALFEIDRQMARRFPDVPRVALMHDVVDAEGTLRHFAAHRPHAVFHAAAHKHVPLMEDHPSHAVTNNLFGTKSVADAALACGAERFVMISSDKAVNPTSVMGATKRLAEMYVQSLNEGSDQPRPSGRGRDERPTPPRVSPRRTSFTMVRFGNVLGSACSVLPIWSGQLAEGGPLTVTDPRMTRYFMTINEAATLVIQAGAIEASAAAQTPSILVLDMGAPVRILDLARRFARLSGFEPRVMGIAGAHAPGDGPADAPDAGRPAIEIVCTGARPGEKLHEELAYDAEALLPTPYPGIMALASSTSAAFDIPAMLADLAPLRSSPDRAAVGAAIRRHVPEMVAPSAPTIARGAAA